MGLSRFFECTDKFLPSVILEMEVSSSTSDVSSLALLFDMDSKEEFYRFGSEELETVEK